MLEGIPTLHLKLDNATLDRTRRRAVTICIVTTATVALAEILIGVLFNLISITAEGLHTAADLFDSLIAYFLVMVASLPADRNHPYGHGKFDSLGALIEGSFVVVTGGWAAFKGAAILIGYVQPEPRPEGVTVLVMVAASILYIAVSGYVLRLARQTDSPLVYAEAMHLRTHVYITLGLAAGLGLSRVGLAAGWSGADHIDALVAVVLGAYLIGIGVKIVRPGFRQLMDTALPEEDVARIAALLEEFRDDFVEVHGIRTRGAGTDRHVDIHLVVQGDRSVQSAHDLAHHIERRLRDSMPGVRLLVHVEPALGRAWQDYLARNRVGRVVMDAPTPFEAEADHHEDALAHRG